MNDYRAEELQAQQEEREFKLLTALIAREYSQSDAEEYAKFVMYNWHYQSMTFREILDSLNEYEVCSQCGEVTEQDYMVDTDESVGGGYGDVCEWCWGNK
jgi:rubrerythrin